MISTRVRSISAVPAAIEPTPDEDVGEVVTGDVALVLRAVATSDLIQFDAALRAVRKSSAASCDKWVGLRENNNYIVPLSSKLSFCLKTGGPCPAKRLPVVPFVGFLLPRTAT